MGLNLRSVSSGAVVWALGLLVILMLTAAPTEARFKIKLKSTPKPSPAPILSKPHIPAPRPDAPKARPTVETASRVPAPGVSRVSDNRGFFSRMWDWLLWRKPMPAPAPQPAPQAVATAPGPPAAPGVVVPILPVRAAPGTAISGNQATGPEQEKEKRRAGSLEESLRKMSVKTEPQPRPAPTPTGYILHLTNGRAITVANYEDKGDQVVIPQMRGTYGLHKSLIARIEPQGLEAESTTVGGGRR